MDDTRSIAGKTRLPHLDLLKTLAIYLVLVFHGTMYAYYPTAELSLPLLRYLFRTILATCVPLFFFASGYLLMARPLDLRRHSLKILRMVLVTCFWMGFLLLALQPFYQEYFTWDTFAEQFWNLRGGWNNQLWYMGVLVCLYLFFPLLKRCYDGDRKTFCWFTAVTALLVFGNSLLNEAVTVLELLVKREFNLRQGIRYFQLFNPFSGSLGIGMGYFCMGGLALSLEERIRRVPARRRNLAAAVGLPVSCTLLGVLAWKFSLYSKEMWPLVWNGYETVFTLCSVWCLYLLSLNLKREVPLIRVISRNTLGIYLLHDLIHKSIGGWFAQFAVVRTVTGTLVYALILLLLSLGACLVLKKLPLVKHLV